MNTQTPDPTFVFLNRQDDLADLETHLNELSWPDTGGGLPYLDLCTLWEKAKNDPTFCQWLLNQKDLDAVFTWLENNRTPEGETTP